MIKSSFMGYTILVLVLFMASSAVMAGLTPSEPIRCSGNQEIVLTNRIIKTSGDGVFVSGNCEVKITNCTIDAGGIGVRVHGNGQVLIEHSRITGARLALIAEGNGQAMYSGTTFNGRVTSEGNGELIDNGGNHIHASATSSPSRHRDSSDADEEIHIGPDGITISDVTGDSVKILPDGTVVDTQGDSTTVVGKNSDGSVRIQSDDSDILVTGDQVRIKEDGKTTTITGDWRNNKHSIYTSSDTNRVMTELNAREKGGEIQVQLAGDILFDFGKAALREAAKAQLAKIAHLIRRKAVGEVVVLGHTDSKGKEDYNVALSRQRAAAVIKYLHYKEGIPAKLLVGKGMGSKKPVAYNTMPDGSDNAAGRAKNRRVEVVIKTRKN